MDIFLKEIEIIEYFYPNIYSSIITLLKSLLEKNNLVYLFPNIRKDKLKVYIDEINKIEMDSQENNIFMLALKEAGIILDYS